MPLLRLVTQFCALGLGACRQERNCTKKRSQSYDRQGCRGTSWQIAAQPSARRCRPCRTQIASLKPKPAASAANAPAKRADNSTTGLFDNH
jgi:hypothetical protein